MAEADPIPRSDDPLQGARLGLTGLLTALVAAGAAAAVAARSGSFAVAGAAAHVAVMDADDGSEVFSFVPQQLLPNGLAYLEDDASASPKVYGLDGHVEVWRNEKTHQQSYERGKPLTELNSAGTPNMGMAKTQPIAPPINTSMAICKRTI